MFHIVKRKILTLKKKKTIKQKNNKYKKKRAGQCGSARFYGFFQNCNRIKA